jgi:hypothetical protein
MHSTISRMEGYFGLMNDPFLRDRLRGKISDVVLDSMVLPNSVVRRRHTQSGVAADARRIFDITLANVARARKAGVQIALGTDSGGPGQLHGASVARELELLNRAGLTPMEAIVAGTRTAAEVIGQGAALGTVEPGKLADLIVLDADPLHDISNIRTVSRVMRDGELIETATLGFVPPPAPAGPPSAFQCNAVGG